MTREQVEMAMAYVEHAIGMLRPEVAAMKQQLDAWRRDPSGAGANPGIVAAVTPFFEGAIAFVEGHDAHLARVKAALKAVGGS